MRKLFLTAALACAAHLPAWSQPAIQLEPVLSNLSSPVLLTHARDGSNRLFIVEQSGTIKVLRPGAAAATDFLNLAAKLVSGGERGLLGMAFHPQFASNRRFFVNYTRRDDGATVVSEFRASAANPDLAETAEKIVITIAQPYSNHNGGMIEFGPDGFLYIGMGDGGSGNDPENRAQNVQELLGKMLRLNVDPADASLPYAAPPDNPFFGPAAGRDEIYATGLRNPWRFSFDRATGELYAGDVGQTQKEEIDVVTRGGNYGWRVLEGTRCTTLGPAPCAAGGFTAPIDEYDHSLGRCSVTGGYVYRGGRGALPPGGYVFGDYCSGEIFLFHQGARSPLLDTSFNISSFGEDEAGELYVINHGGAVLRIVRPPEVISVSAASFRREALAVEGLAAAYGANFATATEAAPSLPLPTRLAGAQVRVRDAAGVERLAPLFFVSPTQVNYQVPGGTAPGAATVTVTSGGGIVSTGMVQIAAVAPALFAANQTGQGPAAGVVQRVRADGSQVTEPLADFDAGRQQFVARPIDLGPEGEQVFLVLFGTGLRFRSGNPAVGAQIGGTAAEVTFAGPQPQFVAVDQVNLRLPRSLQGRGEVEVALTVDGQTANPVSVSIR